MRILFFQISDIHLKECNTEIEKRFEGVANVCNSLANPNTVIVFILSGDMTFSGEKAQFDILYEYLNKMKNLIINEHNIEIHFVCVPGNHDCHFSSEDIANENSVRSIVISSLDPQKNTPISKSALSTILEPQTEYRAFKEKLSMNSVNDLIDTMQISTSIGNILFILVNTSWLSKYHEEPGKMFFPTNKLDDLQKELLISGTTPFIVTVYHHPSHWFHPDNKVEFDNIIHRISDIVLIGHEHRDEQLEVSNKMYNVKESVSPAFIKDDELNSSFNVFIFDNNFLKVKKINYTWKDSIFIRNDLDEFNLIHSEQISCNIPNAQTKNWLDDLELPLPHYKLTRPLTLSMIYCWQNLDHLYYGTEDQEFVKKKECIETDVYSTVTQKGINIIIGDTHSGKTSMAKMIYKTSGINNMNCLYIAGKDISSFKEEKLVEMIENEYKKQYNDETLENFRQLSSKSKILIIDNFLDTSLSSKRLGELLNILTFKFSSIILFINSNLEISMLLSQFSKINSESIVRTYKILPMGNVKRNEMIKKWYELGDDYAQPFDNNEDKILKATEIINQALSGHSSIIPAYPMYILFWLSTIDNGVTDSSHENNYTYFYSILIRENLLTVVDNTKKSSIQAQISIYESALSRVAYSMLRKNDFPLAIDECVKILYEFKKDMSVQLNIEYFIELMIKANILIKTSNNECLKFKYPYIYFYFVGKYIEHNYESKDIQDLVQFMSQHLYNESYANIMIFVCSLSININNRIIDDILLNALCIFDDEEIYNFETTPPIMLEAEDKINNIHNKNDVGNECDVEEAREERIRMRDDRGVYTGQIDDSENTQPNNEEDDSEKYYRDFYAAQKIITVLGQIIRNYPGEISGSRKEEIIEEIHNLGMRLTSMFHNMVSSTLDDLLDFIENRLISVLDDNKQDTNTFKDKEKFKKNMTALFALLLLEFTQYILELEAGSFGDENSIIAGRDVLNKSISGQLALFAINFKVFHTIPIDEVIECSKKLKKEEYDFAYMELKSLVATFLKYNTCGVDERNRLCSEFGLTKKTLLIEEIRSTNNK